MICSLLGRKKFLSWSSGGLIPWKLRFWLSYVPWAKRHPSVGIFLHWYQLGWIIVSSPLVVSGIEVIDIFLCGFFPIFSWIHRSANNTILSWEWSHNLRTISRPQHCHFLLFKLYFLFFFFLSFFSFESFLSLRFAFSLMQILLLVLKTNIETR